MGFIPEGIAEDKWIAWKRKRQTSFIGFILIGTLVGVDCSVVFSTLFLYLKDLVKTDQPETYYSIIVGCFYLASAVAGAIFGRWLDRTRRVRAYINITLLVQIVGFALYLISYHPAFLVVGRTICGISEPFTNVITGEIFRIYDDVGSKRALTWLGSIYSIGFIAGPSLNFAFAKVNIKVGWLVINKLNCVGIFMIGALLIVTLIANFIVHDCSAEIDLKQLLKESPTPEDKGKCTGASLNDEMKTTVGNDDLGIKGTNEKNIPVLIILKQLFSNADTFLIYLASFVFTYAIFSATIMIPLIVSENLKWSLQEINGAYAGMGAYNFCIFLLTLKFIKSNRRTYIASVGCIALQTVVFSIFICFTVFERNVVRDIILMVLFLAAMNMGWWFEDVFIRDILGKIATSKIQSFAEGLRAGTVKLSMILGSFTLPFILPIWRWWSVGMLLLIIGLFIGFIIRKKHLMDPKQMSFSYQENQIEMHVNNAIEETKTGHDLKNGDIVNAGV